MSQPALVEIINSSRLAAKSSPQVIVGVGASPPRSLRGVPLEVVVHGVRAQRLGELGRPSAVDHIDAGSVDRAETADGRLQQVQVVPTQAQGHGCSADLAVGEPLVDDRCFATPETKPVNLAGLPIVSGLMPFSRIALTTSRWRSARSRSPFGSSYRSRT